MTYMVRMLEARDNVYLGEIKLEQQPSTWNEVVGFERLSDGSIVFAKPTDPNVLRRYKAGEQVPSRDVFLLFFCWLYVDDGGNPLEPVDMDLFTAGESKGLSGVRMEKFLSVPREYLQELPATKLVA